MASNQNIDIIINAVDEASGVIRKIQDSIKGIPAQLSKATQASQDALGKIKKSAQANQETFTKVGAVGGIAFAGISVGISQAITDASNLNNSLTGLKSIVVGTGGDFDKAKKIVQSFTADGLVTAGEAATSLKNLVAKGFSLEQAEQLMIRFKDSAAFGRQAALGLGEAIAGATEGIKNENSMLVDNAGVTKNVSAMVTEYAKAHGLKETALTAAQKNEAVYQGILKETQFQVGDAAKLTKEYSGQVAKLDAQKLQLSQTIGATLMPVMTNLIGVLTPTLTTVMNWTKENPKLAEAIILGTLAVAGLAVAIGTLGLLIPGIITGFGFIATAAGALGTALVFLATNPIGLILTALAAIVAASIYIYNNWETIRPKLIATWDIISKAISGAVNAAKVAVGDAFDWIQQKVEAVTNWLGNKVTQVMEYAAKVKSAISDAASAAGDIATGGLGRMAADYVNGARANGGPVNAGGTYLVGERGPELFTTKSSGTIIPNEAMGGGSKISMNISLGGVSVRNDQDIKRLTDEILNEATRRLQLGKLGIA